MAEAGAWSLANLAQGLRDLIFPPACPACGGPVEPEAFLCPACAEQVQAPRPRLPHLRAARPRLALPGLRRRAPGL